MVREISVPRRPAASLQPVIGSERYARLTTATEWSREHLGTHTIWNINSTAAGGGVAEMLWTHVGYAGDLGLPVRWLVISGDPAFFATTKRLHNLIHGQPVDRITPAEASHYAQIAASNAAEILDIVKPGDIVLLHDPQTAGLTVPLAQAGVSTIWRSHIGTDKQNNSTRFGWEFLRPPLLAAQGFVFSRMQYVPSWLPAAKTWIVPPSIDPLSAKNQELSRDTVRAILGTIGVLSYQPPEPGRYVRKDGKVAEVIHPAFVAASRPPENGEPVILQVSRWDRLKDMSGVMRGFADYVAPHSEGYLILAGPQVSGVSDDPEGAAVYGECFAQWQDLPPAIRERVMLINLPMDDLDENAAMVNALQRYAAVTVQKSLAEGFGLTVAEAMWKGRPVVGSAVGGITDQITEGVGMLLADPYDLETFGGQVRYLLDHPDVAEHIGTAAQAHIRQHFLGDTHLLRYVHLFPIALGAREAVRQDYDLAN